jgi:hypothetical protein
MVNKLRRLPQRDRLCVFVETTILHLKWRRQISWEIFLAWERLAIDISPNLNCYITFAKFPRINRRKTGLRGSARNLCRIVIRFVNPIRDGMMKLVVSVQFIDLECSMPKKLGRNMRRDCETVHWLEWRRHGAWTTHPLWTRSLSVSESRSSRRRGENVQSCTGQIREGIRISLHIHSCHCQ